MNDMARAEGTKARPEASDEIRVSLGHSQIHAQWESAYRTDRNERFYDVVFDELVRLLPDPAKGSELLDAGCGAGAHSLRLARRGFSVRAVDFSEPVLEPARRNARADGLDDRVRVQQADLLALPFEDGAFTHVLCWGVLMHVPEVGRAIAELTRVTAPGGVLVIYEVNARSPEAFMLRLLMPRLAKSDIELRSTPAGVEHWTVKESGPLMWRHAEIDWLVAEVATHGLSLRVRRAGQLSEQYHRLPGPLARAVHRLNTFWFDSVRRPRPAIGNLLVFEKRALGGPAR